MMIMQVSFFVPEDREIQPEHIESCKRRSDQCNCIRQFTCVVGREQYFFLTEETRKRWDTFNCQAGEQETKMRKRHILSKPAHISHVITVNHMYHSAGTEE